MATTSQQAEAIERRLRPVYDAIDNGQNKKAIQQADKVLKKHSDLQCAKALKAVALLRVGRNDEGMKLVDEVIDTRPGDSATLQAVFLYCRETGDFNKMVSLYEAAAQSYPSNEEILTHLYMSYVRVDDYQKQQKTAVQLLKQFPKNAPYYCWRVMSVVMQANSILKTDPKTAHTMFLPLAEKLMEKYVADKRAETEQEVRLYLMILKDLERHEKILEVVTSELGGKIRYPEELLAYEMASLTALNEWKKITDKLKPIIQNSPDDWTSIKLYIEAQINNALVLKDAPHESAVEDNATGAGSDPPNPPLWLSPIHEAKDFIDSLADCKDETVLRYRGPVLAQLQLLTQLKNKNVSVPFDDKFSSFTSLLLKFFKRFSSKICCFSDMKCYVDLLSETETQELLSKLTEYVDGIPVSYTCQDEQEIKTNVSNLYTHMSLAKLKHYCGTYDGLSRDQKLEMVADYKKRFEEGLSLGASLAPTVNQYSDFYIQQAAQTLLEVYEETNDVSILWNCVVMVETAQRKSSTNPQILLLLLKMYGYLGAVEYCTRIYNSLAIKHIQVDTLGYLTNRYIQSMGAFGFAGQMFQMALRFYTSCNKETMDHVTNAYKNGVFNKIVEMVKLRDRLHHSLEYYALGVESFQQDFMNEAGSLKQLRSFFAVEKFLPFSLENVDHICSSFVDNRDLQVFDVWTLKQSVTKEQIANSFSLESLWIKLKLNIIQSLKLLVTMDTTTSAETIVSKLTQVKEILEESRVHPEIENLRRSKCSLLPIQSPPPCQLFLFITSSHSHLLKASIDIVIHVLSKGTVSSDMCASFRSSFEGLTKNIKGISPEIQEKITPPLSAEDSWTIDHHPYNFLLTMKIDIEPYVLLLVVSSWMILMFGVCIEHKLAIGEKGPSEGSVGKKKRKKKAAASASVQANVSEEVVLLCDVLTDMKESLLGLCAKFRPLHGSEKWLTEKLSKLSLNDHQSSVPQSEMHQDDSVKAEVYGGVLESYNTSFSDCQDIVRNLASFIDSIMQSCPSSITRKRTETASFKDKVTNEIGVVDDTKKENLLDSTNTI